jgi:hypothetical protein
VWSVEVNQSDSTAKIIVSADVNTLNSNPGVTIGKYKATASDHFTLLPPHFTIYPLDGTWNSIITLKGRFNPKSSANLIKVGGYSAEMSSFNKDSVRVIIPISLANHMNAVSLSSSPFNIVAADSFRLAKPVITSISPASGMKFSSITVKGRFLRNTPMYNFTKVTLGDFPMYFTFSNDSILVCSVPWDIPNGVYKVTVIVGNQVVESEESFTVTNPVINDFSPKSGTFNDVITISGENFLNQPSVYISYFGTPCSIVSATQQQFNSGCPILRIVFPGNSQLVLAD